MDANGKNSGKSHSTDDRPTSVRVNNSGVEGSDTFESSPDIIEIPQSQWKKIPINILPPATKRAHPLSEITEPSHQSSVFFPTSSTPSLSQKVTKANGHTRSSGSGSTARKDPADRTSATVFLEKTKETTVALTKYDASDVSMKGRERKSTRTANESSVASGKEKGDVLKSYVDIVKMLTQTHLSIIFYTDDAGPGSSSLCRLCLELKPQKVFRLNSDAPLYVMLKHCATEHTETCSYLVDLPIGELDKIRLLL